MTRRGRGLNGLGDLPDDIDREGYRGDVTGYGGPQGVIGLPRNQNYQYVNRVSMNNRAYHITDTSTLIIPANINRKYLIIVNTGSNVVYVSFGANANVIGSVPIQPGGNYEPWVVSYSQVSAITDPNLLSQVVIVEGFYENV